ELTRRQDGGRAEADLPQDERRGEQHHGSQRGHLTSPPNSHRQGEHREGNQVAPEAMEEVKLHDEASILRPELAQTEWEVESAGKAGAGVAHHRAEADLNVSKSNHRQNPRAQARPPFSIHRTSGEP